MFGVRKNTNGGGRISPKLVRNLPELSSSCLAFGKTQMGVGASLRNLCKTCLSSPRHVWRETLHDEALPAKWAKRLLEVALVGPGQTQETRFKEELKIEEPRIEEPKIEEPKMEPCDHSGTGWNSPHHRGELTDAYTTNGPPRPQNNRNKDRQAQTRLGIDFCSDLDPKKPKKTTKKWEVPTLT